MSGPVPRLSSVVLLGVAAALIIAPPAAARRKAPPVAVEPATPAPAPAPPAAPSGFREMNVIGVVPSDSGGTVMLTDVAETVVLPIGVGPSEALSIALRLDRRRYQRPLTHDLMDSMMRELGGTLVQVRVDDLIDQVYVATVVVQQGERTVKIDSRASDAIALALGAQIPIYFADVAVEKGSIPWDDFLEPLEEAPPPGFEPEPLDGAPGEEPVTPLPEDPDTTSA